MSRTSAWFDAQWRASRLRVLGAGAMILGLLSVVLEVNNAVALLVFGGGIVMVGVGFLEERIRRLEKAVLYLYDRIDRR